MTSQNGLGIRDVEEMKMDYDDHNERAQERTDFFSKAATENVAELQAELSALEQEDGGEKTDRSAEGDAPPRLASDPQHLSPKTESLAILEPSTHEEPEKDELQELINEQTNP